MPTFARIAWFASTLLVAAPAFAAGAAPDDLDVFAQAIAASPGDAKAYENYALAAMKAKRNDEAIVKLKQGVARIDDFARGYYLMAVAYRNRATADDAVKGATQPSPLWADAATFYRCYIVLRPQEFNSYFGLAKSLQGMGDKAGALANFKKYVSLEKTPQNQKFTDDAKAQIALLEGSAGGGDDLKKQGDKLVAEKKFEEAAAVYRKAIEADPKNLEVRTALGNTYFALKRFSDAAQAFKDAVTQNPKYDLGWYNLAYALRKADRKAESVDAYKAYLKLKPDDPDPYYGLAKTLKDLGDVAGAVAAYRTYIEKEKRPEEQKYVEKAKVELSALEAQLKPATPSAAPNTSGKISDDK